MENYSFSNKNVSISGKSIILNWRNAKMVKPENLQENIRVNESAEKVIKEQKGVNSKIQTSI